MFMAPLSRKHDTPDCGPPAARAASGRRFVLRPVDGPGISPIAAWNLMNEDVGLRCGRTLLGQDASAARHDQPCMTASDA